MNPGAPYPMRHCPHCAYQQAQYFAYCGQCGYSFVRPCTQCNQLIPLEFRFCGHCRSPQQPQMQPAPPTPYPQAQPLFQPPVQPMAYPMPAYPPHPPAAYPPPAMPPTAAYPQPHAAPPVAYPQQQPAAAPSPQAAYPPPMPAPPPASAPAPIPEAEVSQAPLPPMPGPPVPEPPSVAEQPPPLPPASSVPVSPAQVKPPVRQKPEKTSDKPMASAVARMSERRRVAILFCDLCGFTAMSEKLDPEEVSNIMHPLFEKLTGAINKFEGVVEKFIGDAIMALFGVPNAHEDDPERAILAAMEMGQIIRDYSAQLEAEMGFSINMRIGLNVGTVVSGSVGEEGNKDYTVVGDAINTAARMEQNARPGHILVTEDMYKLTHEAFEFTKGEAITAKGKKEPLQSYEVVGLKDHRQKGRGFGARRVPFIGRVNELAQLYQIGANIPQSPLSRFIAVEGDAGLGKTRLITEVYLRLKQQHDWRKIHGVSTSYSVSFSYFLMQSLLKDTLGINENTSHPDTQKALENLVHELSLPNREMVKNLLSYLLFPSSDIPSLKFISPERLQQQIFKALADFLIAYGRKEPLFIAIDDLHWCDSISLDWLQFFHKYLGEQAEPVPLLVSVTHRNQENVEQIHNLLPWDHLALLAPLSPDEARQLFNAVLEFETTPEHLEKLCKTLIERSNCNPYYIEEVLKILIADQILIQKEEVWILTQSVKQLPLPNSIQRLIISRFDKLSEKLRTILQVASVIGGSFSFDFICSIQPELRQIQESELQGLIEHGFLYKQQAQGETRYGFQQVLTQEIIYNTLLNKRKAELHQRLGNYLEESYLKSQHNEILGLLVHHFVRTQESNKAIKYLYMAAAQAARMCANEQALDYYAQALEILFGENFASDELLSLDTQNTKWISSKNLKNEMLEAQADIYWLIGKYDKVIEICEDMLSYSDNVYLQARLYLKLGKVMEKRSQLEDALTQFEQGQDILSENATCLEMAKLWNAVGWVHNRLQDYDAAQEACQTALSILAQTPDMQEIAYANNVIGVVNFNRHEWEKALEYYEQSLGIQEQIQDLWGIGNSLNNMGNVYVMTNRWEEAMDTFIRSLDLREQLGDLAGVATSCNNLGHICQEKGQYEEATTYLDKALKIQLSLKNQLGYAIVYCNLGMAYQKMQQWESAIAHLQEGLLTLKDLKADRILPEVINSMIEIYLAMEQPEQAQALITEIEAGMEQYGDPLQKGKYQRLIGTYHQQIGESDPAREALEKALVILQATGNPTECLLLYRQLYSYHQQGKTSDAHYWKQEFESLLESLDEVQKEKYYALAGRAA